MDNRYQYVGVVSAMDMLLHIDIKRASLIFDKIAVPNIASESSEFSKLMRLIDPDIDFLLDQGIIIDPVKEYMRAETYRKATGEDKLPLLLQKADALQIKLDEDLEKAIKRRVEPNSDLPVDRLIDFLTARLNSSFGLIRQRLEVPLTKALLHAATFAQSVNYDRRQLVHDLADRHQLVAFPLYVDDASFDKDYTGGKSDVLQISLRAFPEPVLDDVPWERLLDFRNDPETIRQRMAFRSWVNNTVRKDLKPIEIHDEIEDLCARYSHHIKIHSLKAQTQQRKTWVRLGSGVGFGVGAAAALGTLVPGSSMALATAAAIGGFVGDLFTWLADKGTDAIFSVKERKIDLSIAEANAPGCEVAYIACIRNEFS